MQFERAITPRITIGDQPTAADLERLRAEGYTGVVNLRNDGEPDQPIATGPEGDLVRNLGMAYHHLGIGAAPLTPAAVRAACDFIGEQGKVMVHCKVGGRAAGLVLIQQAQAEGWPAAEAIARGRGIGLEVGGGLRLIVEKYLDDHASA